MVFEWIAVALLVTLVGVLLWQDVSLWRGRPVRTMGRVIGHRRSQDDGTEYFIAQVEYVDRQGQAHKIEHSRAKSTPWPALSALVSVVYPESAPGKGRVPLGPWRLVIYLFCGTALAVLLAHIQGFIR